jgi:hypothetical protein
MADPLDVASYVSDMASQLAIMSAAAGHRDLSVYLQMAATEASLIVRLGLVKREPFAKAAGEGQQSESE